MKLSDLKLPFSEDDIEWRIGQAGKSANGKVWARCLAYVQARAIMNRLDDVCGPENWRVFYRFIPGAAGMDPGVICELSIKTGETWVPKEDGAEQTDIESFKGGISAALKRAGSTWGIGRYLYRLEAEFAEIVEKGTKGAKYAKTKDGIEFYWVPPALPGWALPVNEAPKIPAIGRVVPMGPERNDGIQDDSSGYRIPFGKYAKRSLEEIDLDDLRDYVAYIENKAVKDRRPLNGQVLEFVERATAHVAAFENSEVS